MLLETYEEYLKTLTPYANSCTAKLTAPKSMLTALTDIAHSKRTTRLDVIRLALAKYIHEESRAS